MSNVKINTEETVLRVPKDTPANADSNSVRAYTDLIILDLPTSDPLTIGALWNDSEILKISSGS